MKKFKAFLIVLGVLIAGSTFVSCTDLEEDIDEQQEIHSVDKRDIERPGSQGGN